MIRKMLVEDIEELQILDKLCFKTNAFRRFELMGAFIHENASLVYVDSGRITGYIFNHILGSFAWFGTLGIHPDFRGKDIGKNLVKETINIFHNEFNVKNIGLVTMSESAYNVGFYTNLGFKPERLALRLYKNIDKEKAINPHEISTNNRNLEVKIIDIKNKEDFTNIIHIAKDISSYLYPGIDMSPQLEEIERSNMGTCFIVYENKIPVGFGILRNKEVFTLESTSVQIKLLCLKNEVSSYEKAIDAVLNKTYEYAIQNALNKIIIDVNTYDYEVCSHLMTDLHFKIDKTSLTLIMGDLDFYSKINGLVMFKTAT